MAWKPYEIRDGKLMEMAGDGSTWALNELNRRMRVRRGIFQRTKYALAVPGRGHNELDWREGPPIRIEELKRCL